MNESKKKNTWLKKWISAKKTLKIHVENKFETQNSLVHMFFL